MTFIALLFSAIFCAGIVVTQKHTGPVWVFSPPVLMVAYFGLVNVPGIVLIEDSTMQDYALFAHCLWMLGVLLSCLLFFRKIRKIGPFVPSNYYYGNTKIFYIFIIISIFSVVITFVMFGRAPLIIALRSIIEGDGNITMHEARQMNTLEHRYSDTIYFGQGYLRQLYAVIGPIFCSAVYLFYRIRLRRSAPLYIQLLMIFFVIAGAMNGQIWVAANVIILFILVKFFADTLVLPNFNTWNLIKRAMLSYIGLLIFVFAYRYLQYLQGRRFVNFTGDTLDRIYSYSVAPLFLLFPDMFPYRLGSTWINDLMGILPGSSQLFSYEVHYLVHGGAWGFTLSPGIVASSYVNFGYLGVLLTAVALTAIFTFLFNRLVQSRDVVCLSLAIYLSFSFLSGIPGDLISYIVSLVTVLLVYVGYRLVAALMHPRPQYRATRSYRPIDRLMLERSANNVYGATRSNARNEAQDRRAVR